MKCQVYNNKGFSSIIVEILTTKLVESYRTVPLAKRFFSQRFVYRMYSLLICYIMFGWYYVWLGRCMSQKFMAYRHNYVFNNFHDQNVLGTFCKWLKSVEALVIVLVLEADTHKPLR